MDMIESTDLTQDISPNNKNHIFKYITHIELSKHLIGKKIHLQTNNGHHFLSLLKINL